MKRSFAPVFAGLAQVAVLAACGSHLHQDSAAPQSPSGNEASKTPEANDHAPSGGAEATAPGLPDPVKAAGPAAPRSAGIAFPLAPQLPNEGGPILSSPRFVAVTFPEDPLADDIERFVAAIGSSHYWAATTSEYGVGPATAGDPIRLQIAPPATLDEITFSAILEATLAITGGGDEQTVFAFFFPETTTFASLFDGASCGKFNGQHDVSIVGQALGLPPQPYAVIGRCGELGFSKLDAATATASHEFVEAATDPRSLKTQRAWADDHFVNAGIALALTAENGDWCHSYPMLAHEYVSAKLLDPTDPLSYVVQRTWSNASAAAGHDPCVPRLPNDPYFTAFPVTSDPIEIQGDDTTGFALAKGETRRLELDLHADAPLPGPFSYQVRAQFNADNAFFKAVPDGPSAGKSGDKLFVKITNVGLEAGVSIPVVVETFVTNGPVRSRQYFALTGK
jgi:hypothetical protein